MIPVTFFFALRRSLGVGVSPFSLGLSSNVTLAMTMQLRAWSQAVWGQINFGPAILLKSPRVLLTKPQFELRPTLDILNFTQLMSLQYYGIVDLAILMTLFESTVQICPSQIYRPDMSLSNLRTRSVPPRSTSMISSQFQTPGF
jgi:hypothetical protein